MVLLDEIYTCTGCGFEDRFSSDDEDAEFWKTQKELICPRCGETMLDTDEYIEYLDDLYREQEYEFSIMEEMMK